MYRCVFLYLNKVNNDDVGGDDADGDQQRGAQIKPYWSFGFDYFLPVVKISRDNRASPRGVAAMEPF